MANSPNSSKHQGCSCDANMKHSTQSLVRRGASELGILGSEGPPSEGRTPGREQQDSSLHPFPSSAAGLWPNGPHSDCMSTTQLLLQATSVWPTDGQRLERGLNADSERGQQRWQALRMALNLAPRCKWRRVRQQREALEGRGCPCPAWPSTVAQRREQLISSRC